MESPYLVEVRTGGQIKAELREIIYDVADEFGIRGAADPRPVPHIPLFGRYDTEQGPKVKESLLDLLSEFDVVPYRVSGFGEFEDRQLIYANVVPSPALCLLRRRIAEALRPVTYKYPSEDQTQFEFHIPVAYDENGREFDADAVLDFLKEHYHVASDEYATRVTNLDGRRMLWEYDLLQDRVLGHDEATSRESWQRTESLLEDRSTDSDHRSLVDESVGTAIALAQRVGWEYFPDPHDHVTDRARRDGLFQADGTMCQRGLYFGDDYAYLVFAAPRRSDSVHVLSQPKAEFNEETVETECPICGAAVRRHDRGRLLPCHRCGFQLDRPEQEVDRESENESEISEMCVRCNRPLRSGGVVFDQQVYCDDCVTKFESVAERGVVVRSRHGEPDYEERPYVVHWDDTSYVEEGQIAALARGKELADANDAPGLFVYERHGSHWLLDTYLDSHPDIEAEVTDRRRRIRGEDRVQIDTGGNDESEVVGHDIRAEGDVFIADTAIKDAVINRSDVGDSDSADGS